PLFIRRAAYADGEKNGGKKLLICIFQRGAADGLSMVVPRGDRLYYKHRPAAPGGIALPETGEAAAVDLDGFFALHPALSALKPIYQAGHLAPVPAVGSPNNSRSHFDAQDFMESGAPGEKLIRDGWLARALQHCPEDRARRRTAFRAVAMTPRLPRSFSGGADALAIPDLN